MKIYKILIMVITILLTGCSCKEPEPIRVIETVYVNIPVKCILPKVKCDLNGNGYVPTVKLLECVIEQKRALEVCDKSIIDNNTSN